MKHILPGTLMLSILVGCSSERKDIEHAAYGYLDAMANYRLEDARTYASSMTNETTLEIYSNLLANLDSAYIASNTPATITLGKCQTTSDTTAYVLFHKSTPITQQDDTLRLIKEKGAWLAHVVLQAPSLLQSDSKRITPSVLRDIRKAEESNLRCE